MVILVKKNTFALIFRKGGNETLNNTNNKNQDSILNEATEAKDATVEATTNEANVEATKTTSSQKVISETPVHNPDEFDWSMDKAGFGKHRAEHAHKAGAQRNGDGITILEHQVWVFRRFRVHLQRDSSTGLDRSHALKRLALRCDLGLHTGGVGGVRTGVLYQRLTGGLQLGLKLLEGFVQIFLLDQSSALPSEIRPKCIGIWRQSAGSVQQ